MGYSVAVIRRFAGAYGEIAPRVEALLDAGDIAQQLDVFVTSLVLLEQDKVAADGATAKLREEIDQLKERCARESLQVGKLRKALAASQRENDDNKVQLETLERYFQARKIDISMPLPTGDIDESRLWTAEDVEEEDDDYRCSAGDIRGDDANPFQSRDKRRFGGLASLSIMRKSQGGIGKQSIIDTINPAAFTAKALLRMNTLADLSDAGRCQSLLAGNRTSSGGGTNKGTHQQLQQQRPGKRKYADKAGQANQRTITQFLVNSEH